MVGVSLSYDGETTVEAKRRLEQGYKKTRNARARHLLYMLIFSTPVDRGEARGAWRVTQGGPATFHDDSHLDPSGQETYRMAERDIERVHHFADLYITNTAPHFPFLEDGHSGQAPIGVIRVALPAFKAMHPDVT